MSNQTSEIQAIIESAAAEHRAIRATERELNIADMFTWWRADIQTSGELTCW